MEEEIIACPSLLVLRQEDGAVRPEKRKSLRYATDSRSWRYKASLPRKNKIALKEVKGKARQVEKIAVEREDGAVRPEKRKKKIALKTKEGKARQVEEIAVEKREREDGAVRPEEKETKIVLFRYQ